MGANDRVTLGQIGYGYWGPNVCRNLMTLDEAHLKYVCDASDENLKAAGERCAGARLVKDPETIFADPDVDAVVITSPAVTHYELALEAMRAGKHVFVEKPMSLEVEHGQALLDASLELGRVLMVGHIFLYHPAVAFLKDYVDSGEMGEVLYLYSQRLNLGRLRHDENCLWSLAPHDISLMLHVLDSEPVSVSATGASYLRDGLEDVVFFSMKFPGGQIGNCHVSWLDPHKMRKFTIVGSQKMVVFDDMCPEGKIKIFDKRVYRADGVPEFGKELYLHVGEESTPEIAEDEPLRIECQHFLDCVKNGLRPRSDGSEGLAVLRVLKAASMSLESGGLPTDVL